MDSKIGPRRTLENLFRLASPFGETEAPAAHGTLGMEARNRVPPAHNTEQRSTEPASRPPRRPCRRHADRGASTPERGSRNFVAGEAKADPSTFSAVVVEKNSGKSLPRSARPAAKTSPATASSKSIATIYHRDAKGGQQRRSRRGACAGRARGPIAEPTLLPANLGWVRTAAHELSGCGHGEIAASQVPEIFVKE